MKSNKMIAAAVAMALIGGSTTGYLPVISSSSYEVCAVEEVTVAATDEAAPQIELPEEECSETFMENVLGTVRKTALRMKITLIMIRIKTQVNHIISLLPPIFNRAFAGETVTSSSEL